MSAPTAAIGPAPPPAKIAADRVQVTRGIACLLLVAFHIFGGNPDDGLRIADDSGVRRMLDILLYLRMPLFAFISGYVYALKPLDPALPKAFLVGKLRRLGLPVLSATTIFFVLAWLRNPMPAPETAARLLHAYFFAYEIYWFLQAMLLIFMLLPLLERYLLQSPAGVAIAVLVAFLLTRLAEPVDFLSINGAAYLAPFFFIGIGARRFVRLDRRLAIALTGILLAAAAAHVANVLALPAHAGARRGTLLSLLIGGIAPMLIVAHVPPSALLARIGQSSFAVFLFHIFFVVPTRILLEKLGVHDIALHFAAGMAAGICGPMLVEAAVTRNAVTRRVLLGLR